MLAGIFVLVPSGPAATAPEPLPPVTPREYFNAGTAKLRAGKLREAEALLESALASQNERLQPTALYNLGHVRFQAGAEELKKGPPGGEAAKQGRAAAASADGAMRAADQALAGDEVQKLVAAYLNGRGARKELKAAREAVKRAMQSYGAALTQWQRASGDFKSTTELDAADADARQNAEVVDRCIAKLVDSLQELQQLANALADKNQDLGQKLKKLKGRMPDSDAPPGGPGDDDEDEDLPFGPHPGQKEGASKEGEQMNLSPEQAGWLLEGYKLDSERRLPMGQGQEAEPRKRPQKTW
jgi:tetratricopeptide (TPR) repeat protein